MSASPPEQQRFGTCPGNPAGPASSDNGKTTVTDKGYTPSPLLSRRYACLCLSTMLLKMVILFSPGLLFFFWQDLFVLPHSDLIITILVVTYLAAMGWLFLRDAVFSRNYLKKHLLAALREQGLVTDKLKDAHFVDLYPPDQKTHGLDTAYAVGFLHMDEPAGTTIVGQRETFVLVSDVLQLCLAPSQVESVSRIIFRGTKVTRIAYRDLNSGELQELMLGDRSAPNPYVRNTRNDHLCRDIAAAFGKTVENDIVNQPNVAIPRNPNQPVADEITLPCTLDIPFDILSGKVYCDATGIRKTNKLGKFGGNWSVRWDDILSLDVQIGSTAQPFSIVSFVTDEGKHNLVCSGTLLGLSRIIQEQVRLAGERFSAQETMEFHYPQFIYRKMRKNHRRVWLLIAAFVLLLAAVLTGAPLADLLGKLLDTPGLGEAFLELAFLPFVFAMFAIRWVFVEGRAYRIMKRAVALKLTAETLQIAAANRTSRNIKLSYITDIREKKKKVIITTVDGKKLVLLRSLGRMGILLEQLRRHCKRTAAERQH